MWLLSDGSGNHFVRDAGLPAAHLGLPVDEGLWSSVHGRTLDVMGKHKWQLVCDPPTGLVRPVRVDPAGLTGPTRMQVRGAAWRTTSHGLYVPASVPTDVPEQRILEQAARLPPGGAVTGWAACRVLGGNFFDGLGRNGVTPLPVPLAVGQRGNLRRDPGAHLDHSLLAPGEVSVRWGIPHTKPERGVFDAMRFGGSVGAAVVALEMAVGAGITSIERMRGYADAHAGWEGIIQVRAALRLAREGARSPREVDLRLILEEHGGFGRFEINCPVEDRSGRLLGIADLLEVEAGLVVEFDGADHRDKARHTLDLAKDEALRGVGLEVTRFSGTDLHDQDLVLRRALAARGRAKFDPEPVRRWVACPVADGAEARLREREALAELAAHNARLAETHGESA